MLDYQKLVGSGPVQSVRWLGGCTYAELQGKHAAGKFASYLNYIYHAVFLQSAALTVT